MAPAAPFALLRKLGDVADQQLVDGHALEDRTEQRVGDDRLVRPADEEVDVVAILDGPTMRWRPRDADQACASWSTSGNSVWFSLSTCRCVSASRAASRSYSER